MYVILHSLFLTGCFFEKLQQNENTNSANSNRNDTEVEEPTPPDFLALSESCYQLEAELYDLEIACCVAFETSEGTTNPNYYCESTNIYNDDHCSVESMNENYEFWKDLVDHQCAVDYINDVIIYSNECSIDIYTGLNCASLPWEEYVGLNYEKLACLDADGDGYTSPQSCL